MDNPPKGIIPATMELAEILGKFLSQEHLLEIRDTCPLSPREALLHSLTTSTAAFAMIRAGVPVFIMGVGAVSPITGFATVWMLGSKKISRHAVAVMRAARWGVQRCLATPCILGLEQYIPQWYTTGLNFATRLGFVCQHGHCTGVNGSCLIRVALERTDISTQKERAYGFHGNSIQCCQHNDERLSKTTAYPASRS